MGNFGVADYENLITSNLWIGIFDTRERVYSFQFGNGSFLGLTMFFTTYQVLKIQNDWDYLYFSFSVFVCWLGTVI